MAHQVLARKWRPQVFSDLAGQAHVVQALSNALEQQRLHHAYLFSGTRGIGKTTIARILARCLNCEQGVTATPCGTCASCVEISEGRSLDLIEVDAASRTKVDDTRELLENVQFAPTHARYKIYLIDEVHMLSNSSFNALLKTIEEPPEHVIFLFATTHPQKMPATVLSRCLQFHLKNMTIVEIMDHLQQILTEENIAFEKEALGLIGKAAAGSMRDALSLTEQAIAFGANTVEYAQVQDMLGVVSATVVFDLLKAIAQDRAADALQVVRDYASQAVDFALLIDELLAALHRVAVEQTAPQAGVAGQPDAEAIQKLARHIPAEDIQLYYQTALLAKRDLPLAPDPLTGLEMMVLRLFSYRRMVDEQLQQAGLSLVESESSPDTAELVPAKKPEATPHNKAADTQAKFDTAAVEASDSAKGSSSSTKPAVAVDTAAALAEAVSLADEPLALEQLTTASWCEIFQTLPLSGVVRAVGSHCLPLAVEGDQVKFALLAENAMLFKPESADRLAAGLSIYFGRPVSCLIELVDSWRAAGLDTPGGTAETPSQYRERVRAERRDRAIRELQDDADVQTLLHTFDATLDEQSIEFIETNT